MKKVMFSKMLQESGMFEVAEQAVHMGFDGIDLTCREGGHVKPENVLTGLKEAVNVFSAHRLEIPVITTGIMTPKDPFVEETFEAAGNCGIPYVRIGYWIYEGIGTLRRRLNEIRCHMDGFEELARKHNVCAVIHIHCDGLINAVPALVWMLLADRDPKYVGAFIDPAHMAMEGGGYGWILGMDMLAPYIKPVSVKNFSWVSTEKEDHAEWRIRVVPVKDGIVPWPKVMEILSQINFDGYLSMHSEYCHGYGWRPMSREEMLQQTIEDMQYIDKVYEKYYQKGINGK